MSEAPKSTQKCEENNLSQGRRKLLKSGVAKSMGRLMGCTFILGIKFFMYMLVSQNTIACYKIYVATHLDAILARILHKISKVLPSFISLINKLLCNCYQVYFIS